MATIIKVLTGIGFSVPLAGTIGGTCLVALNTSSSNSRGKQASTLSATSSTNVVSSDYSQQNSHSSEQAGGVISDTTTSSLEESPQTSNVDLQTQEQIIKEEEKTGNCTIVDPLENILEKAWQNPEEYYSVSCDSKGIVKGEYDTIPDKWEGAFPKLIFKRRDLNKEEKLEIIVKEDDGSAVFDDYDEQGNTWPYDITFSGNSFIDTKSSPLLGRWDYLSGFEDREGKVAAKVKLTQPDVKEYIYLLWRPDTE